MNDVCLDFDLCSNCHLVFESCDLSTCTMCERGTCQHCEPICCPDQIAETRLERMAV